MYKQNIATTQKNSVLGKIICVDSWCKFAGGYQTVPGGIRGRLLKISYGATQKNGAEWTDATHRSLRLPIINLAVDLPGSTL